MRFVEPIEFKSVDDIVNNFNLYKEKFINESILCFRNANLSEDQQYDLNLKLADLFGWHQPGKEQYYKENHGHNPRLAASGPDEVILSWHVEHPYYENPIVASTWNMLKFKTDSNNGKTYFVDMCEVYNLLSDKEKEFLNKIILSNEIISIDPRPEYKMAPTTPPYGVIKPHWLTGKPTLRISMFGEKQANLFGVGKELPTQEDQDYLNELIKKISKIVATNEEIRIVHKWQEGDLLIPDLFKLAHAVTGGFDPNDREFKGIWAIMTND